MQPQLFSSHRSKIAYIISLLSGWALQSARAIWDANGPVTHALSAFTFHFKEVFVQTASSISALDQLFHFHQGKSSVSDYALQFHTLAAISGKNETVLIPAYRQGINPNFHQQMAIYDYVIGFIDYSIRIAQWPTTCKLDLLVLHSLLTSATSDPSCT